MEKSIWLELTIRGTDCISAAPRKKSAGSWNRPLSKTCQLTYATSWGWRSGGGMVNHVLVEPRVAILPTSRYPSAYSVVKHHFYFEESRNVKSGKQIPQLEAKLEHRQGLSCWVLLEEP